MSKAAFFRTMSDRQLNDYRAALLEDKQAASTVAVIMFVNGRVALIDEVLEERRKAGWCAIESNER